MRAIGKLERVEIRSVWRVEPEFTTWLAEHTEYIAEVTHAVIPDELQREQSTANFRVDLVGQTDDGDYVVVENQFGSSDHDHLGKLITYAAASKAKTAVWIVESARAEHIDAINVLNQVPATSFYMLALEVVQIGDSLPAPKLTLITGPSAGSRSIGQTKVETGNEQTEAQALRAKFYSELLQQIGASDPAFQGIQGTAGSTLNGRTSKPGIIVYYNIKQHLGTVGLFINTGDAAKNDAIFRQLLDAKDEIEEACGKHSWENKESMAARNVWKAVVESGYRDGDWAATQKAMISAMEQFESAVKPHIDKLKG